VALVERRKQPARLLIPLRLFLPLGVRAELTVTVVLETPLLPPQVPMRLPGLVPQVVEVVPAVPAVLVVMPPTTAPTGARPRAVLASISISTM
jgi:hypothetical protein